MTIPAWLQILNEIVAQARQESPEEKMYEKPDTEMGK